MAQLSTFGRRVVAAGNGQTAGREVDVLPAQAQKRTFAQAGVDRQVSTRAKEPAAQRSSLCAFAGEPQDSLDLIVAKEVDAVRSDGTPDPAQRIPRNVALTLCPALHRRHHHYVMRTLAGAWERPSESRKRMMS